MSQDKVKDVREVVDAVYRSDSRQVLATLIRLLGDFETAEEALHEQTFATDWDKQQKLAPPTDGHSISPGRNQNDGFLRGG